MPLSVQLDRIFDYSKNEDPHEKRSCPTCAKELVQIEIDRSDRVLKIEVALPLEQSKAFIELLRSFKELFASSPSNKPGIAALVITHELNIDLLVKSIAKINRVMGDEKKVFY